MTEIDSTPEAQTPPTTTASQVRPVNGKLLWFARLMLLGAMGVSSYLLIHSLTGGGALAGCGADTAFDCESVLASHWSKVATLPTSALAIATYIILLGALNVVRYPRARLSWLLAGILAVCIVGSAIWFSVLQLVILKKICIWCMSAHVLGTLGSLAVLILTPRRSRVLALVGIMPVLAMLSLQVVDKDVTHLVQQITPAAKPKLMVGAKQVLLMGNRVAIDPSKHPLLGSPDADHFLMYLFDYTCPHCRALHKALENALKRYGNQLTIIALPMPLNSDCNPLVKHTEQRHKDACSLAILSLAVFHAHPEKFHEYDQWLVDAVPDAKQARAKAIEIFGSEQALAKAIIAPWVSEQLERDIKLYKFSGGGVVPKLIGENTLIAGRPGDPQDLYDLLEDEMGIKPIAGDKPTTEQKPAQ